MMKPEQRKKCTRVSHSLSALGLPESSKDADRQERLRSRELSVPRAAPAQAQRTLCNSPGHRATSLRNNLPRVLWSALSLPSTSPVLKKGKREKIQRLIN